MYMEQQTSIINSDNGLSPVQRQTVIWTNAEILLNWPLETNFTKLLIKILTVSLNKMHLKESSAKWRPLCLGFDVLISRGYLLGCLLDGWYDRVLNSMQYSYSTHNTLMQSHCNSECSALAPINIIITNHKPAQGDGWWSNRSQVLISIIVHLYIETGPGHKKKGIQAQNKQ